MASSLILFLLSANILPIGYAAAAQGVGSLSARDVLPGGLSDAYKDYELVHLEEREGEDTVYITKRAPVTPTPPKKECDDCAWFTPWLENYGPAAKRDILDGSDADANVTTHRLQARKTDKDITDICKDFRLSGVNPLSFGPYPWPSNADMESRGTKKVYDFKPYDEPDQESYYELKLLSDYQSRGGSNKAVSVEHVLEWQVLLDFVRENKERCEHFAKYFQATVAIDTTLKVEGKDVKVTGTERAIDWIAHQYPGNNANGIANKFMYEFVSLHDDVNGRKMLLWSEPVGTAKKAALVNDNKMKKWLGGQYWTKTITYETDSNGKRRKIESNKLTKSDKNQGLCEAVVTLRDIVGVYKYHTYKDIQDILTAQIDRIGTALEYLETGPLKTAQIPDPANPTGQLAYVPMATGALKAQWDAYIKKKYTRVIADLEKTMDDIVPKLKKAKLARRGLLGAEKRGTGSTRGPLCGEEPDKTKMNKRIDYVIDAYEKKGTWKNPVA